MTVLDTSTDQPTGPRSSGPQPLLGPERPDQATSGFQLEISKWFGFEAGHRLNGLPDGHKCGRAHGHSYQVEVRLTAQALTGPGFVTDFGELEPFATYIADHLDHRDLNAVLAVEPTSELLAVHLARWFLEHVEPAVPGRLVAVTVKETTKTSATCTVIRP
ncbi:6-pyruvoyl trahydropterin synthase family protein [Planomonospora sphaerica]|uniref:6-pyruvoyl trahydropterin synthase family protein n=1 Tax=Planomonospora sphaerica TaxID=161355 RepID=UPI000A03B40B|nr:6-carboxytetrahydropterin synthase [Planomonospora sphaerica]